MLDTDLDAARKILEVNVLAALQLDPEGGRRGLGTAEAPGGAVVNVASDRRARRHRVARLVRREQGRADPPHHRAGHQLGPQVRVNAVAPAVVKTQFATALYEGREEEVAAAYPMKRLGVPEDIAGAVVVPAVAPTPRWITGQTLVVDGGVTLGGGL